MTRTNIIPIRPPLHGPRRRRCNCGRRPLFVSFTSFGASRPHTDRSHPLCRGCYRRLRDSMYQHR